MAKKEAGMTKVENKSTGTKVKNGVLGVILNVILWLFSLTCIFPLIWMFRKVKQRLTLLFESG